MTAVARVEENQSPDWDSITEEFLCPLCEYNLRGLSMPRCPECGCQFEWNHLFDRANYIHPYLFEHHRKRNVWSFFKTNLAGFRPIRFWSSVRPAHEVHLSRLIIYWIIWYAALALTTVAFFAVFAPNGQFFNDPWSLFDQNQWYVLCSRSPAALTLISFTLFALTWPWLTLASLMVFQTTMKRSKIRTVHVLRCIIYSSDTMSLVFLLALMPTLAGAWFAKSSGATAVRFFWLDYFAYNLWVPLIFLGNIVPFWILFRLMHAYQFYLHFRHAIATILASQVMVCLTMLLILFCILDAQWLRYIFFH